MNPILGTDSYKISHWKQYPPGTTRVRSYFESRGGAYKKTLFAGLQYHMQIALTTPVTEEHIEEADELLSAHLGPGVFNRTSWEYLVREYGGYYPLSIRAVPEGYWVPTGLPLFTVENLDRNLAWLTNYVETRLSHTWYPTTVATLSGHCRQIILGYLERTGDPSGIDFKLHDFGYRGSTSDESAAIGGWAHLINFQGSDTLPPLVFARKYYGCAMAAFSIPAAEHSTITSWGRDHEVDAFRNMLTAYPNGLVAVVSDSYDIYAACEHLWGETLRAEVLGRQGVLVVRPDSGDPPEVVHKCLDILGRKFGSTVNAKGYKVLDPHVRVIQGDGVDPVTIDKVLAVLEINGWSADNVAFGMGGALLQKVNRDTCRFAFKCSEVTVDGVDRPVYKNPVGDPSKASKAGPLSTYRADDGSWFCAPPDGRSGTEMMREVYRNGQVRITDTMDDIRSRARAI